MHEVKIDRTLLLMLRMGVAACFAGWSWMFLYWEGPLGVLLWNESTFQMLESFGVTWEIFTGSGANDGLVQAATRFVGLVFRACVPLALFVRKGLNARIAGLCIGSFFLLVAALAKYVTADAQLPMFIEYGGQVLIPVILVLAVQFGVRHRAVVMTAIVAVVMTFAGHGAFALGVYWPMPSTFTSMTRVILNVDYEVAVSLMRLAGTLDLLVCLGLFVPRLRIVSAGYAAVWGLLTALARPVAGMSASLIYWGADQFIHEAVYRAPHAVLPLFLFLFWRSGGQCIVHAVSSGGCDEPETFQQESEGVAAALTT